MFYYHVDIVNGRPCIRKLKAFGFRRKNKMDQVFIKTLDGYEWIYATPVKAV